MTAEKNSPPLWAVVMAGGSGTRFWPVSRQDRPKQFLPPGGGVPGGKASADGLTLLEETLRRLKGLVPPEQTLIIGSQGHGSLIRKMLPGVPARNIILEPEGRNTAPCIGLAAHLISARAPEAVMAVLPSDHHIRRPVRFRKLLRRAARIAAEEDAIVTLGIPPTAPETGFGYIERGRGIAPMDKTGAYAVKRFTEKPRLAAARRYLAAGKYYWNGGYFIWRAGRAIAELDRHLPKAKNHLRQAAEALRKRDRAAFHRAFKKCPSISIDYAVMEKAKNIIVLPADIGWNDLGSWTALRNLLPKDAGGNLWLLPKGSVAEAVDAKGLIVRSGKPLVAALGVENLIVIETGDALLLCHTDRAQEVGDLVRRLGGRKSGKFV
ncbi:MAG: mannose-1-phosphate guanylyltransferase [bacterium]|nr:mannose-1-phosphate guanylyltransferase [bacterium]